MDQDRILIKYQLVLIGAALIGAAMVWMLLSDRGPHGAPKSQDSIAGSAREPAMPAATLSPPPADPVPVKAIGKSAASQAITTATSWKVQPPVGTKVRDVIAQLKADADAGEPTAACRVGTELTRCWQNRELVRLHKEQLGRLSNVGSAEAERIRRTAADLWTLTAKDRDLCEGVSNELIEQSWRYLLNAALKGNVAAMEQFVVGPPLSQTDVISSIEGWNAYRDYGHFFLHQSLEAGSVRALYLAFFSTLTGMGPGGRSLLPRDPYQAVVYGSAALPLVDEGSAQMIARALPALQSEAGVRSASAVHEGRVLRDRFYGGKSPAEVSSGLGVPQPGSCLPQ